MVYITEYKKKLLVNSLKINDIEEFLDENLDFNLEKGVLFSDYEEKIILTSKNFFSNWKKFLEINNYTMEKFVYDFSVFERNKNLYYLYSVNSHAYHTDSDCEVLNRNFKDYKLDEKIPEEKLSEYKEWFKTKILEHTKSDIRSLNIVEDAVIGKEHMKKWGEEIDFPIFQDKENSGHEEIFDSKEKIISYIKNRKKDIKDIIQSIGETPAEQDFFISLLKDSYKTKEKYRNNKSINFYREELQKIHKIKIEMIDQMKSYYIHINDEEFFLNPEILETLNFKKCKKCKQQQEICV